MSTLSSMLPLSPIPTSHSPQTLSYSPDPTKGLGCPVDLQCSIPTECRPLPKRPGPEQLKKQLSIPVLPGHAAPARMPAYISARACREELECGEAVDFHCFHFISSRVHLGNDNVLMVPVGFSQLVPDWGQLLAVTTPWGIC